MESRRLAVVTSSIFVFSRARKSGELARARDRGWREKDKLEEAEIICSSVRACNTEKCGTVIFRHTSATTETHNSTTEREREHPANSIFITMSEKFPFVLIEDPRSRAST